MNKQDVYNKNEPIAHQQTDNDINQSVPFLYGFHSIYQQYFSHL